MLAWLPRSVFFDFCLSFCRGDRARQPSSTFLAHPSPGIFPNMVPTGSLAIRKQFGVALHPLPAQEVFHRSGDTRVAGQAAGDLGVLTQVPSSLVPLTSSAVIHGLKFTGTPTRTCRVCENDGARLLRLARRSSRA
ncbi:uncharacterized protein C8Q71DRAFT_498386 [Rhodofomes roseus]|uniref:Secreted protein n=1 Tax=Rhodofomes roseus TaxID=34475 RepID=A0ABQ8KM18_9APHY|nr:uncharacterized protein C8Q71DRAFT_498386 [Rhodofomes roseus]KAH9839138.1 hypothetical protein C8Q71DRAFT_498386 [Rhodofomes roseus]